MPVFVAVISREFVLVSTQLGFSHEQLPNPSPPSVDRPISSLSITLRPIALSLSVVASPQEVYNQFVEETKKANSVPLAYPKSRIHLISRERSGVLYYVGGWILSRMWAIFRRRGLPSCWMQVVDKNHSKSKEAAVEKVRRVEPMTWLVCQRNDAKHGAGLLFPTLEWFEFLFAVENGYFHFLSQPMLLGSFVGDLPAEILKVVSEEKLVQGKWARCAEGCGSKEELEEMFHFVIEKFHHAVYPYFLPVSGTPCPPP